jgi:hypothetical protein
VCVICVCVRASVCAHASIHPSIHTYIHTYIQVCKRAHMQTHMRERTHTHVCVCVCVCVCVLCCVVLRCVVHVGVLCVGECWRTHAHSHHAYTAARAVHARDGCARLHTVCVRARCACVRYCACVCADLRVGTHSLTPTHSCVRAWVRTHNSTRARTHLSHRVRVRARVCVFCLCVLGTRLCVRCAGVHSFARTAFPRITSGNDGGCMRCA